MGCKGLNITIPYKQNVLKLCNEVSTVAKEIQAVNTLIPNSNNGWTGTNTDIEGFLKPLEEKQLEGKRALVLGCGGSARAVVAGLKRMKLSQISVMSRNHHSINTFLKDANALSNSINDQRQIIEGIVHDEIKTTKNVKK